MLAWKGLQALPPCVDTGCQVLILGTAPGAASLRASYYYAHPRNAFWRILADVFKTPVPQTVGEKEGAALAEPPCPVGCLARLRTPRLPGQRHPPARANGFAAFFAAYPRIERVLFNGAAAGKLFFRHCAGTLAGRGSIRLPSTSPAYTLPYAEKLALWRKELLS